MKKNSSNNSVNIRNSDSPKVEQLPVEETVALSKVEQTLHEECAKFEDRFDYPVNPAFLHTSQMKKSGKLLKFDTYCHKNGLHST